MSMGIRLRLRSPQLRNADNLHRIAIANLEDQEQSLRRWWHKKYRIPPKPLDDYTAEELYLEHLEDFYERNPKAAQDFLRSTAGDDEWDGEVSAEHERQIQERLARLQKKRPVDIKKYQSEGDENLSDEDIAGMLSMVGRDLPGSRRAAKSAPVMAPTEAALGDGGSGEFDEQFEG